MSQVLVPDIPVTHAEETESSSSSDGDTSEGEEFNPERPIFSLSQLSLGRRRSSSAVTRGRSRTPAIQGTPQTPRSQTPRRQREQDPDRPHWNKLTEIHIFDHKTRSRKSMTPLPQESLVVPPTKKRAKRVPKIPKVVDNEIKCPCGIQIARGFMIECTQCKSKIHGPCAA